MTKLYVSNKDESARLFKSDFLEIFTHVHWIVPVFLFVPVTGYFLWRTSQDPAVGAEEAVTRFLAGILVWTLTEYLLHRFVFHYEPTSRVGQQIHFLTHGVHHDYPNDSGRLVMPPAVSIPLAALFYGLFLALTGPSFGAPFFAGFIVGYICYDEIHYATHHAPMNGKVGQFLKHHHILHHFKDPGKRYGVSSPLWDYVFGTAGRDGEEVAVEN
jgi:sterol desaturase/sphingolipid hydroxylase (fatty acid hydroxylase superfamily)